MAQGGAQQLDLSLIIVREIKKKKPNQAPSGTAEMLLLVWGTLKQHANKSLSFN